MVRTTYEAHDPSWFKLVFEYGTLGALAFFAFFLTALFLGAPAPMLAASFLFIFLLLGGYLQTAAFHVLFVALSAWHGPEARR
jgi:hypothetical protein